VNAVLFTGSGHGLTNVPGAFFWVTVAGTNVPAQSNVGYICTNDLTPVTIALPASLSIGDTFKVAGIGDAGWIIAQTNGQTIFAGNLSSSIGQSWETNGPSANWRAIVSSADGTKLAAAINGGTIYTSTNSGATWISHASSQNWSAMASSADGTKLVATVGYTIYNVVPTGQIWTSTDSGVTWANHASSLQWSCVASSADGSKVVAAVHGGSIYTNSGTTWTAVGGTSGLAWNAVASSADGRKLVAVEDNGSIYTSTNSGATWLLRTNGILQLQSVASSSDGTRLVAAVDNGLIYISTDSGANWSAQNPSTQHWTSVASSAEGSRLAATVGDTAPGNILRHPIPARHGRNWVERQSCYGRQSRRLPTAACSRRPFMAAIFTSLRKAARQTGATGYLSGEPHSAIELIYTGNGIFLPLNHEGTVRAY